MRRIPFVVGQWVRGAQFYGRNAQIDEILRGPRDSVWLLGTRRIGKTSLLKQLEHLTAADASLGYLPVFWDLQGTADPEALHEDFRDALLDAEDHLEAAGIDLDKVEADDAFQSLNRLRRAARRVGRKVLLLCDEAEELIVLSRKDPALLGKLRRALQSRADVRAVLASTIRLWDLTEQSGDTSPFLHGFAPPLYIERLTDAEARSLVLQQELPTDSRPAISEGQAQRICSACDNHPYLLQLVSKRFLELDDLEESVAQVASDRMVGFFFSIDFEMLSALEQSMLAGLAGATPRTSESLLGGPAGGSETRDALQRLERLGFLRRDGEGAYSLANQFFRHWLENDRSKQQPANAPPGREEHVVGAVDSDETQTLVQREPDLLAGRYRLLGTLGEGAMGVVHKALDTVLRSTIAVKILKPELRGSEELAERFRQEILLSRDLGHPHILRVYHLGEADGMRFLTMSWVDGGDLASALAERGRFPTAELCAIGAKVASALAAAHRAGVLHRDLKPQNILLDRSLEPYVTDFGLAYREGDARITHAGIFVGTPAYASPEQANLQAVDARSDLYSLGAVLFEMATGRPPFRADTTGETLRLLRTEPAPDPEEIEPSIEPVLATVIRRCLRQVPSERYPSGVDLEKALLAVSRRTPGDGRRG